MDHETTLRVVRLCRWCEKPMDGEPVDYVLHGDCAACPECGSMFTLSRTVQASRVARCLDCLHKWTADEVPKPQPMVLDTSRTFDA